MLTRLPVLALVLSTSLAGAADIPAHPDELVFPPLDFTPPKAESFRHEVDGVPVYLAPSHEFPLVSVTFTFRGGGFLEAPDEVGLAGMLGTMMREGGTSTFAPDDLDEMLDFLAANVSVSVADDRASVNLNCLEQNFDECFGLFLEIIRAPRFDGERLRLRKDEVLEQLRQRNDFPMSVAMINLGELLYGDDHFAGRQPTQATIEAIDEARLRALHARIFHPGNLYVAATGDFDVDEMLDELRKALEGWPRGPVAGRPEPPTHEVEPGLYHARVAQQDLPQGTAILVGRSLTRDDPDALAFRIMNDILGGGGFSSRIMNRVRSDEGLAYGAMTAFQPQVDYPGIFAGFFQSKNRTVALATKIMLEEMERIRDEPVSEAELETAKNGYIQSFPQQFASKSGMLARFVSDELTGRDPAYWQTVCDRVEALDAAAIQRVAREHLHPEDLIILVVGDWDEIYPGDLEGRASMSDFHGGNVKHLPMRDPLTLEPIGN